MKVKGLCSLQSIDLVILILIIANKECVVKSENIGCPCLSTNAYLYAGLDQYRNTDNTLQYQNIAYPSDYGVGCKQHDLTLEPYCSTGDENNPAFCEESFCYIDKNNCDLPIKYLSAYFPNSQIYYSYQTCGAKGTFTDWFVDNKDGYVLSDLITVVETYVKNIRDYMENSQGEITDSNCAFTDGCDCPQCNVSNGDGYWGGVEVDFADSIQIDFSPGSSDPKTSCEVNIATSFFQRIAGMEYQKKSNIGYLYGATHDDSVYYQWPATRWVCEDPFNPQLRPWYSIAASGRKSVVLVMDVSGSMSGPRIVLAKAAINAVLDTLTYRDQVKLITFNHGVVYGDRYQEEFVYADKVNKARMRDVLDKEVFAGGGTAFYQPLDLALKSFTSDTRSCSNVILFLTDGIADVTDTQYEAIKTQASSKNVVIFTYALGSGADVAVANRIACDNKGIQYSVGDSDDLAEIMASYYTYFTAMTTSFDVRWILYEDYATKSDLIAGCIAVLNKAAATAAEMNILEGVVCMDLTVMANIDDLKANAGYDQLIKDITEKADTCTTKPWSDYTAEETNDLLKKIRANQASKGAQSCEDDDSATTATSGGLLAVIIVIIICFVGAIVCCFQFLNQTRIKNGMAQVSPDSSHSPYTHRPQPHLGYPVQAHAQSAPIPGGGSAYGGYPVQAHTAQAHTAQPPAYRAAQYGQVPGTQSYAAVPVPAVEHTPGLSPTPYYGAGGVTSAYAV